MGGLVLECEGVPLAPGKGDTSTLQSKGASPALTRSTPHSQGTLRGSRGLRVPPTSDTHGIRTRAHA